jgi:ribosomal protein L11 methylase PrmA
MSRRRWLELGVKTGGSPDDAGHMAEALLELGGKAVEERAGWLFTHVEAPDDLEEFEERARGLLSTGAGDVDLQLRVAWRDHVDWSEAWKRGLEPRRITDRLVVTPSWHTV